MAARLPIPALDTPGITLDFNRLREAGIAHIANLSSHLWTDYNSHDPGITILEVLCYAITDLGFRTDFLLQDLLAPAEPQSSQKQFFTAAEILPCNPVTPDDLRKILIDIPEIKNAWFFVGSEPALCQEYFFAFSEAELLEIEGLRQQVSSELNGEEQAFNSLDELYNAFPQFVSNLKYRDVLRQVLTTFRDGQYQLNEQGPLESIFSQLHSETQAASELSFKASCQLASLIEEINSLLDNQASGELETHQELFIQTFLDWRLVIREPGSPSSSSPTLDGLYYILVELQDDIDSENQLITNNIKEKALRKLHRYRNLAEDFQDLQFIELKEISLDTVIEIETGADQNAVKAQAIFAVQQYFTPPLRFYSLQDMLNKGKRVEEIFQTVALAHGFMDETELERSKLRRVIYKSDLYQAIMQIPGVKAVKCLEIDFCRDEDKIITDEEALADQNKLEEANLYRNPWCFDICKKEQYWADKAIWEDDLDGENIYTASITCVHKPVLPPSCVNMKVEKEGALVIVDEEEVKEKLSLIQLLNQPVKVDEVRELEAPNGQYRDLHSYFSIQNDFPLVYRAGEGELPPSAPPRHKAQVHQLKAFLTFFDQILANYVASLSGVKDVLAVEQEPEDKALFYKSLRGIVPNFDFYLIDFYQANQALLDALEEDDGCPNEAAEILREFLYREPMTKTVFIEEISRRLGSYWNAELKALILQYAYLEDYYEQRLEEMLEGNSRSFALRNNILDHLIARFGETFTDYVFSVIQSKEYEACKGPRVQLRRELTACKTEFLRHIPILGRDRGKAFNMLAPDCGDPDQFWDSGNVAGLKKRISKLLCLPPSTATRTKLSCDPQVVVGKNVDAETRSFKWAVVKESDTIQTKGRAKMPRIKIQKDATIYLEGVKTYSRSAKATKDRLQIYDALLDSDLAIKGGGPEDKFLIIDKKTGTDFFELILRNERGTPIAKSPDSLASRNRSDLEERRRELLELVFPSACGDGGFHLLEHILLRPFSDDIPLLEPFPIPEEHRVDRITDCGKEEAGEKEPESQSGGVPCLPKDPYSFWISLIAPDSWRRFPEGSARHFFQQAVRREAPAHIGIRFLWLSPQALFRFEELYKNWLYDEGRRQSDNCQIEESLSALINFLNELANNADV